VRMEVLTHRMVIMPPVICIVRLQRNSQRNGERNRNVNTLITCCPHTRDNRKSRMLPPNLEVLASTGWSPAAHYLVAGRFLVGWWYCSPVGKAEPEGFDF